MKKVFTGIAIDQIDEVRANSVTPEKFEEIWGYSLKEHVDGMMEFIHELESEAPAERVVKEVTKKERLQPEAIPVAAAKMKTAKSSKDIQEEMKRSLSEKIQNLVEKILTEDFIAVKGIGEERNCEERIQKLIKRRLSNKKNSISWKLKLVAVKEESEESIATGVPMVIRNLDNPDDDISIVARTLSLKKKMLGATPTTKPSVGGKEKVQDSIKGVQIARPTKGVNILSVDVGRLDIG